MGRAIHAPAAGRRGCHRRHGSPPHIEASFVRKCVVLRRRRRGGSDRPIDRVGPRDRQGHPRPTKPREAETNTAPEPKHVPAGAPFKRRRRSIVVVWSLLKSQKQNGRAAQWAININNTRSGVRHIDGDRSISVRLFVGLLSFGVVRSVWVTDHTHIHTSRISISRPRYTFFPTKPNPYGSGAG